LFETIDPVPQVLAKQLS